MSRSKIIIYHCLSIIMIAALISALSFYLYPLFPRFIDAWIDLGNVFKYLINKFFDLGWNVELTINNLNYIPGFSFSFLPENISLFFKSWGLMFINYATANFWGEIGNIVAPLLLSFVFIVMVALPLLLLFKILFKNYFSDHDEAIGKQSKPYKIYIIISDFIRFICFYIKDIVSFIKTRKLYRIILLLTLLFFTNIITILISFIAFYIYIVFSFDLSGVWMQVVRLVTDLSYMFNGYWIIFWIVVIYIIIKKSLTKIALLKKAQLMHKNIDFVKYRTSISTLFIGLMGLGKTTLMTDVTITSEAMFKDIALEKMIELSTLFNDYDFRKLEIYLDEQFAKHEMYNLATTKTCLANLFSNKEFQNEYITYDERFNDGIKTVYLSDIIFEYAQLYYIYSRSSSLIYSNYAIRSGLFVYSDNHLRQYINDFIESSSDYYDVSNFSHIFDFNNFRSGKKINNRIEWSKASDIGIFSLDEIGKERLNMVELEDVKKGSDEANQKNDGFNKSIKMGRHMSTVSNYPFFKIFSSEQRLNSVPADYRELNDVVVKIGKDIEEKNVFPFYKLIYGLNNIVYYPVLALYQRYRFNRDDTTLIFFFLRSILCSINRYRRRMDNKYGIKIVPIQILNPSGELLDDTHYYLLKSKIYSRRFTTDAYSDIFNKRGLDSKYGIDDVPSYQSHVASLDEMALQNSYMVNDLLNKKSENKKPNGQYSYRRYR